MQPRDKLQLTFASLFSSSPDIVGQLPSVLFRGWSQLPRRGLLPVPGRGGLLVHDHPAERPGADRAGMLGQSLRRPAARLLPAHRWKRANRKYLHVQGKPLQRWRGRVRAETSGVAYGHSGSSYSDDSIIKNLSD